MLIILIITQWLVCFKKGRSIFSYSDSFVLLSKILHPNSHSSSLVLLILRFILVNYRISYLFLYNKLPYPHLFCSWIWNLPRAWQGWFISGTTWLKAGWYTVKLTHSHDRQVDAGCWVGIQPGDKSKGLFLSTRSLHKLLGSWSWVFKTDCSQKTRWSTWHFYYLSLEVRMPLCHTLLIRVIERSCIFKRKRHGLPISWWRNDRVLKEHVHGDIVAIFGKQDVLQMLKQ